jgi:GalNAc5-diNAcBac-PP-undecaprenol beta-1,3-glucosyltransferase
VGGDAAEVKLEAAERKPTRKLREAKDLPVFSVIIPTHDHADTLWFAVESVLQQTHQDFEIFIIGDGAPARTREIAEALHAREPRIHYFPFEKGLRHGESHRDTVIAKTSAEFVCYMSDDDLWFPDHLETMSQLLRDADLAHTMQIEVYPDGKARTWIFDADVDPLGRDSLRRSRPTFGLECGGHTLAAYRRLPIGWHPAPAEMPSDFYFYRLFLQQPWCRYTSFKWPTALHLSSVTRRGWSLPARVAELSAVASVVQDPVRRARLIRDAFLPMLDEMVRASFSDDQSRVRTRIAELAESDLRRIVTSYSLGTALTFNDGGRAFRFWLHGFHAAENWGSWTSDTRAGVTIAIPEGTTGELRLLVVAMHLRGGPCHPASTFGVAANGKTVFETAEGRSGPITYEIKVPESVYCGTAGCIVLEFLAQLHSPLELGINEDSRRLGVGLISLCLDHAS